ncbi:hypothetical protein HK096_002388, partial [Nowakowskiella sp. JEL0078]
MLTSACFRENKKGPMKLFLGVLVRESMSAKRERANIEEEYARKLGKLAKQFATKEELGSMKEALDTLKNEIENNSRSHAEMSAELRIQVEKPLSEMMAVQSAIRKKSTATLKAKERYESRSYDVEIITRQLKSPLSTKESDKKDYNLDQKLKQKLDRMSLAANQAEAEYRTGTERLVDTTKEYEAHWRETCIEAEKMEKDRLEFLRDNVWNFANMISSVCVSVDESCERIRHSLEDFDVDADLDLFAKTRATGTELPTPIEYIKYQSRLNEASQFDNYTGNGSLTPNRSSFDTNTYNSTSMSLPGWFTSKDLSFRSDANTQPQKMHTFLSDNKKNSLISDVSESKILSSYDSRSNSLISNSSLWTEKNPRNTEASFDMKSNSHAKKVSLWTEKNDNKEQKEVDEDDFEDYDPFDLPATPFLCKVQ